MVLLRKSIKLIALINVSSKDLHSYEGWIKHCNGRSLLNKLKDRNGKIQSHEEPVNGEVVGNYYVYALDVETAEDDEGNTAYKYTELGEDGATAKYGKAAAKVEYDWASGEISSALIQVDYHNTDSSRATETSSYWKAYLECLRDYTTVADGVYSMGTLEDTYTFDSIEYTVSVDATTGRPSIAVTVTE